MELIKKIKLSIKLLPLIFFGLTIIPIIKFTRLLLICKKNSDNPELSGLVDEYNACLQVITDLRNENEQKPIEFRHILVKEILTKIENLILQKLNVINHFNNGHFCSTGLIFMVRFYLSLAWYHFRLLLFKFLMKNYPELENFLNSSDIIQVNKNNDNLCEIKNEIHFDKFDYNVELNSEDNSTKDDCSVDDNVTTTSDENNKNTDSKDNLNKINVVICDQKSNENNLSFDNNKIIQNDYFDDLGIKIVVGKTNNDVIIRIVNDKKGDESDKNKAKKQVDFEKTFLQQSVVYYNKVDTNGELDEIDDVYDDSNDKNKHKKLVDYENNEPIDKNNLGHQWFFEDMKRKYNIILNKINTNFEYKSSYKNMNKIDIEMSDNNNFIVEPFDYIDTMRDDLTTDVQNDDQVNDIDKDDINNYLSFRVDKLDEIQDIELNIDLLSKFQSSCDLLLQDNGFDLNSSGHGDSLNCIFGAGSNTGPVSDEISSPSFKTNKGVNRRFKNVKGKNRSYKTGKASNGSFKSVDDCSTSCHNSEYETDVKKRFNYKVDRAIHEFCSIIYDRPRQFIKEKGSLHQGLDSENDDDFPDYGRLKSATVDKCTKNFIDDESEDYHTRYKRFEMWDTSAYNLCAPSPSDEEYGCNFDKYDETDYQNVKYLYSNRRPNFVEDSEEELTPEQYRQAKIRMRKTASLFHKTHREYSRNTPGACVSILRIHNALNEKVDEKNVKFIDIGKGVIQATNSICESVKYIHILQDNPFLIKKGPE